MVSGKNFYRYYWKFLNYSKGVLLAFRPAAISISLNKSFSFQHNVKTLFGLFFETRKLCNTCCLHKSGYVFQPKRALVDFESFVYSGFSVVVMERCIQHDVLSLFIRVKGPVIQTSLFPGLFVGISIEKPEK